MFRPYIHNYSTKLYWQGWYIRTFSKYNANSLCSSNTTSQTEYLIVCL